MFKLEEIIVITAGILFIIAMTRLGYTEYNLYTDRITIIRKNLFFHPKTTLIEIPINRLQEIEFEKGFFDKTVYIVSRIAILLLGNLGGGKTDNDHNIIITYKEEYTTEKHTETFNFDYRFKNLEDLVKKTNHKIKKSKQT